MDFDESLPREELKVGDVTSTPVNEKDLDLNSYPKGQLEALWFFKGMEKENSIPEGEHVRHLFYHSQQEPVLEIRQDTNEEFDPQNPYLGLDQNLKNS